MAVLLWADFYTAYMKYGRRIISLITALLLPFLISGQVLAATKTVSGEITITAVVPAHRDIILDNAGRIQEIDSNTTEDVTPVAYRRAAIPGNQVPVTAELMAAYRSLVPAGTAKTGVLYRQSPQAIITVHRLPYRQTTASMVPVSSTDISMLFRSGIAAPDRTVASS